MTAKFTIHEDFILISAIPPSSCTSTGKYPAAQCNQYYECVEVMYWYELVLQSCESGHSYSDCLKTCVADTTCNP